MVLVSRIYHEIMLFTALVIAFFADETLNKQLEIIIALNSSSTLQNFNLKIQEDLFFKNLVSQTQDFKEALRMQPAGIKPILKIEENGKGVFAVTDIRIKLKYV